MKKSTQKLILAGVLGAAALYLVRRHGIGQGINAALTSPGSPAGLSTGVDDSWFFRLNNGQAISAVDNRDFSQPITYVAP
ncbi:MAG: hypothetical protein AAFW82_03205 [Pseudomonadota bacterium]